MKKVALILAIILLLSACMSPTSDSDSTEQSQPPESVVLTSTAEQATEPLTTEAVEDTTPQTSEGRQAVVVSRDPYEPFDEDSLFNNGFIYPLGDRLPKHLWEIYRPIEPWDGEGDIFQEFKDALNVSEEEDGVKIANIMVPFLLTDASVNMSDEELYDKIAAITYVNIFSEHTDTMSYRFIVFNLNPRISPFWARWVCLIQAWNDEYIWAQPLPDNSDFDYTSASFMTGPNGNTLLLLVGYSRVPNMRGTTRSGTGFEFKDGVWVRLNWEEMFEQVTVLKDIYEASDGFCYTFYGGPSWSYPILSGPLFEIRIDEEGSFWAEYYSYPYEPERTDIPPNDLLFRLKK